MRVIPGITEMVFSARSTRKVLNAETFPRSTNSVTYLQLKCTEFLLHVEKLDCAEFNGCILLRNCAVMSVLQNNIMT